MAPAYSSGLNTPESELESFMPVHPTAARRPYPIVVQSENTAYSDEFITSSFTNRGADVTVNSGQFVVTPTSKTYQFQTTRKVAKTGYVFHKLIYDTFPNLSSQSHDDWSGRQ